MMGTSPNWPVSVTTIGASAGGTVLFRKDGKLHVTCVLKSTFKLAVDEPMKLVDAGELFTSELHYRDNPTRSIRATSDVVPYLPRVDVILTGHAHAPDGRPVKTLAVRLAIYHSVALLDKKLDVIGNRNGADIVPFERMPLVYEKALGGLGDPQNPFGTGKGPGTAPPNIVDPKDSNVPAGFGPISRALRQRKVLRGNVSVAALDENLIELPADFDWNYFQAAPPDQRLPSLMGNEWIVIEGMHPSLPRIASRLPSVRPIAAMFGFDPAKPDAVRSVQARIDMLRINADNLTCSVVARAVVPIDDERSLATIRIVGAIETEDLSYAHLLTPPSVGEGNMRTTTRIALAEETQDKGQGTVVLGDAPVTKEALPFSVNKKFDIEDELTSDMDIASHHEEGNKPATPFAALGPRRSSGSRRAPIPGAPWSGEPARTAKVPPTREGTMTEATNVPMVPMEEPTRKFVKPDISMLRESPPPLAIPPAPVPVIPPAPVPVIPPAPVPVFVAAPKPPSVVFTTPQSPSEAPPATKAIPAPTKDMWAKTGTELPIVTTKAPPPRIPAKPAVNKAIYGGFGPPKKKT